MRIYSFSPFGYEGSLVSVEVDLRRGIPAIDIVGLADGAVKESRERMQAAIRNSGLDFPLDRVLISLSPADLKKEGAGFDLAIALGVLCAQKNGGNSRILGTDTITSAGEIDTNGTNFEENTGTAIDTSGESDFLDKDDILVLGELELSGKVRAVKGIFPAAMAAASAGIFRCIVPSANAEEAREVRGMRVFGADNLEEAFAALENDENFTEHKNSSGEEENLENCEKIEGVFFPKIQDGFEFSEIKGQKKLVRALQIAAAGGHNLIAVGAPGCGKTLSIQKFPALLPLLTKEEAQSVTRILSLSGLLPPKESLVRIPPFRMPHQSATLEGICGGGQNCRPGEISLSHNGVLFLDEAAEFRTTVLQTLRVPLETGRISLSRAGRTTVYPASFQLLLSTNPCPCGNFGSRTKLCLCSARAVELYWKKLSAPLMDRIDIRVHVENENEVKRNPENGCKDKKSPDEYQNENKNREENLSEHKNPDAKTSGFRNQYHETEKSLSTAELRLPIARAVKTQRKRQGKRNARLTPSEVSMFCALEDDARKTLENSGFRYGFSPRAISSCIKLSRTIADLAGHEKINTADIKEAVEMRKALSTFMDLQGE